ncbi:MAG: hypothetical protein JWO30_204 [Fibrobacteres bacterium]|nr:hypothetical protein [Fibrobacterota bacterium]
MLIVVKLILVAFAVFGQAKLFPEHSAHRESSLDSLVLPVDKPELVLAQRAMAAQGLCPAAASGPEKDAGVVKDAAGNPTASAHGSDQAPENGEASKSDLATNCF